ncbi:hypothetical protein D3C72_2307130 [compost metagenome]
MGHVLQQRSRRQVDMAGDHVVDRRAAALVRNIGDVDTGHRLDHFERIAGRAAIVDLAGIRLGVGDQFGDGLVWRVRVRNQHQR